MTRLPGVAMLLVAFLTVPAAAHADGFLSPYVGVNFGGDTTKKSTVIGGALGFVGKGAGFEVDFGYTPEFFGDDTVEVDGKIVTVMGNLLLGGRRGGFSPYVALGGGIIRTDVTVFDDLLDIDAAKNSFGGNIGGGFWAGGGGISVRGDVRYFRAFDYDDGLADFSLTEDKLSFWRATLGVGLMW